MYLLLNVFVCICAVSAFVMFGDGATKGGFLMIVLGFVASGAASRYKPVPPPNT